MTDFSCELEEIRKLRQAKYASVNGIKEKPKPIYNYELRKEILDWIKKCSRVEIMKECMDKIEKQEYQNKISRIQLEDLDYFTQQETNTNFMIDLFKYSFSFPVLQKAYLLYSDTPHILMIKEIVSKPNLPEDFLLKLLLDYTENNKNVIPIITTTNLLTSKYHQAINLIMGIFYSNSNTSMISYEQLKLIYTNTEINPEQFKFLVAKCSNINGYSKCTKTWIERSNRDLIKNLIHEMETKHKCKLNIDLYK